MLYRVVVRPTSVAPGEPGDIGSAPIHLELVADPSLPLIEGNHIFCSISGAGETDRAPAGLATMTVSTHVRVDRLDPGGRKVAAIQDRMRSLLARLAPEWSQEVVHELPASPRTFERFTGRPGGFVGGIPRRAGWAAYRDLLPRPVDRGLYLVGDSVFPGQSTLATALGGHRVGTRILRDQGLD